MHPNPTQIYQVHLILPSLCCTSTVMGDPEAGGGEGLEKSDNRIKQGLGGMLPSD